MFTGITLFFTIVPMKTILITGCSKGIGLTSAKILHSRGYTVFPSARKARDVAMLKELGFDNAVQLDVDNSDSIDRALHHVLTVTDGKLFALFNNAGFGLPGAIEDLSRDAIRHQFETNVFGPLELVNKVMPVMRKQGYGRIIFNSSILGLVTMPFRGAYNASKFALEGLGDSLRQELIGTNIFVSLIEPGPVATHFRDNAYSAHEAYIDGKTSIHQSTYKKMAKYFSHQDDSTLFLMQPEAITKKLVQCLESKHPKAHYPVGCAAKFLTVAKRMLPTKWLDKLILALMKNETRPS